MAEIGSMTGGLAHEIKNPLSTIGLNAQLLEEGLADLAADPDDKRRLTTRLGALRREVDRLRGILTDFLEFAGQVRLDRVTTDLRTIVHDLVDFYTPEAQRQGVRLAADLPPHPALASIDNRLLKQALLNLILNATQAAAAGDGGGEAGPDARTVTLRVEPGADPALGRVLRLHVIDTGPGLSPDVRARLFTPYFTTKAGGTGLGLPTARRYIEEHGGRIDVLDNPAGRRGVDFCVVIPAEPAEPSPPRQEPSRPRAAAGQA